MSITMDTTYLEAYADQGLYLMQGRLCPPQDGRFQSFPLEGWEQEIELAAKVPLQGIEWIYDLYGQGVNPIETESGRADLLARLSQFGLKVVSICADYFMDCPLLHVNQEESALSLARLEWLISLSPHIGVKRIVLPFVDASRMSDSKDMASLLQILHMILPSAKAAEVELHLETDLAPEPFRSFLAEIEDPLVKVNYDAGNSSALGYLPQDEFAAYGDRIGSFHIKDRVLGGNTVPLGEGDTDFSTLRAALIDIDYQGDFVLQVARGKPTEELQWLRTMNARACRWLRGEPILQPES
jgi:L-ribulose-5-phosphate 3-epimerase